MILTTERYPEPMALLLGLANLRRSGLTPRGLLFLALEPAGAIHIVRPQDTDEVTRIRVGEKLGLAFPTEGRFFHYDSIHRLRDGVYVFNGDRRLAHPGNAIEVAGMLSDFLKASSAHNLFFGCTPHQPGSWLVRNKDTIALHEAGYAEVVPVPTGLLARRVVDHRLWFHSFQDLYQKGKMSEWQSVFESPLGNVLMLERRIINDRLVLSCAEGLVEVDVSTFPAKEVGRQKLSIGFGVVGRTSDFSGTPSFAVTQGKPQPWGLDEIRPAVLIGAAGGSLQALGQALAQADRNRSAGD